MFTKLIKNNVFEDFTALVYTDFIFAENKYLYFTTKNIIYELRMYKTI